MSRTTATLLLVGGDYASRLDRLYSAAIEAQNESEGDGGEPLTLTEESPAVTLRREYEALKAEAEADARANRREVQLLALGRRQWRDFKEKYPPRTDGTDAEINGDRTVGMNSDAAEEAVVFASITSPTFGSRDAFDEWADDLSPGEWRLLADTVWGLMIGSRVDPKSLPGSSTQGSSLN